MAEQTCVDDRRIGGILVTELQRPIGSGDPLRYGDVRFALQLLRNSEGDRILSGNLDVMETLRISERAIRGTANPWARDLLTMCANDVAVAICVLRDVWEIWQMTFNHDASKAPIRAMCVTMKNGDYHSVFATCKESALRITWETWYSQLPEATFRTLYQVVNPYPAGVMLQMILDDKPVSKTAADWAAEQRETGPAEFVKH